MRKKLGLKENLPQFLLLVLVNAFVGGMIGLERAVLPQIAEVEFQMVAKTAIVSFIVVFGLVKAITNYFMGKFANKYGRKRMLVVGWLFPYPFYCYLRNLGTGLFVQMYFWASIKDWLGLALLS